MKLTIELAKALKEGDILDGGEANCKTWKVWRVMSVESRGVVVALGNKGQHGHQCLLEWNWLERAGWNKI